MKVPLSEQIRLLELMQEHGPRFFEDARSALAAALATLKWVEKHQAELRVLAEFPIEAVTVKEAGE